MTFTYFNHQPGRRSTLNTNSVPSFPPNAMWIVTILPLLSVALAHLQMQDPYPIKSPLNQANSNDDKGTLDNNENAH